MGRNDDMEFTIIPITYKNCSIHIKYPQLKLELHSHKPTNTNKHTPSIHTYTHRSETPTKPYSRQICWEKFIILNLNINYHYSILIADVTDDTHTVRERESERKFCPKSVCLMYSHRKKNKENEEKWFRLEMISFSQLEI